MIKVKDKIYCLITLSKTAFGVGIASNMFPPKKSRLLIPTKLSTTSGKSKTVHFVSGNAVAMALAIVPVLPPTSTRDFKP